VPSYWKEFLVHPANQAVALSVIAVGVLASMPYGWDALGLSLLGLAAIETVGLASVPGLPSFRAWVDRRHASAHREARRRHLAEQLEAHGGSRHYEDYQRMTHRVFSLYEMARAPGNSLTEREVVQIDDLVIGYLALCVADAMLGSQTTTASADGMQKKLRAVRARLEQEALSIDEVQQLRKAQAEYEEAIARLARMGSRASALEASLATMPVRLEELYQMVVTAPTGGNLSTMLEESVEKLRLAEAVDIDVEEILGIKPSSQEATRARAAQVAQQNARRL
jgi:hypothetical protein